MTFETERCEHGVPWTVACPVCIMDAMAVVQREREMERAMERERDRVRELMKDDLRRFKFPRKGDLPGDAGDLD